MNKFNHEKKMVVIYWELGEGEGGGGDLNLIYIQDSID